MRLRRKGEERKSQQSIEVDGRTALRADLSKEITADSDYNEDDLEYVFSRFGVSTLTTHLTHIYEHMMGTEPGGSFHLQKLKRSVRTCYLSIRKQLQVCIS